MSFKSDLWTYLTGQLSGSISTRLYPGLGPTSATKPYIIYNLVYGDSVHYQGGKTDLAPINIEFYIQGSSAASCEEIGASLRTALDGYRGTMGSTNIRRCTFSAEGDGIENPNDGTEVPDFSLRQTYNFWVFRSAAADIIMAWEDDQDMLWEDGVTITWNG